MLNQHKLSEHTHIKAVESQANKKLVQQSIVQETGQIVTLRDLSNIPAIASKGYSRYDLTTFVSILQDKFSK